MLKFGDELWAVEIKLTANPSIDDMARLNRAADRIGARRRILVSQVRRPTEGQNQASGNLPWLLGKLQTAFGVRTSPKRKRGTR